MMATVGYLFVLASIAATVVIAVRILVEEGVPFRFLRAAGIGLTGGLVVACAIMLLR